MRMDKAIEINGRAVPFSERLVKVQVLLIQNVFQTEDYGYVPNEVDFQVIYEDNFLLVANKPGRHCHTSK